MKKIDFLLVYPRPTSDSPVKLTPLSILYPGAMFEAQGGRVAYFDERYDPPEMLDELIREAREIGVSAFTGFQVGRAARILKHAKRINPSIVTGVGGHHARILPNEVLAEPFVDKVWPERQYGEDLFPYSRDKRLLFARGDMQYFTSVGCPFPCTFCALSAPWSPKPIDDFDREMKIMHADLGFEEISFSDPNIGFGAWKGEDGKTQRMDRAQRIRDIGRVMRDLEVRWDGNIRSPYLTSEMVDVLEESNCFSIEIGCESGNDYFLRKVIKKGHGVEHIKAAARNVRGSGISIMYSFISGMPRENTGDAARYVRPDRLDQGYRSQRAHFSLSVCALSGQSDVPRRRRWCRWVFEIRAADDHGRMGQPQAHGVADLLDRWFELPHGQHAQKFSRQGLGTYRALRQTGSGEMAPPRRR